jgi:hypothetical protein
MRVIINERQLRTIIESEDKTKKNLKAYKETIDEYGIYDAARILDKTIIELYELGLFDIPTAIKQLGLYTTSESLEIPMFELLKEINYDISGIKPFELFPVLVGMQKEYKGCDIEVDWFSDNSYGVYWVVYKELIGNYVIGCVTMALPEFNEGKVYVENSHCWVDNNLTTSDFNNGIEYNVKTIDYEIPTEFESWDVMVEWYQTKYMPNVYKIMKEQAFEIINQLKQKDEI